AIITGNYPCRTGITGAYFYDQDEDEVHYYGDDIWVILREGFASFFRDFLVKLNHERLQVDTLFDLVEQAGLRAACLNYLWFHGPARHKVSVPWLLRLWPGVPGSVEV